MKIFINYISHPVDCVELKNVIEEGPLDMECILSDSSVGWTVPKSAEYGDIIMFIHTRSAKNNIEKIEKEMNDNSSFDFLKPYLAKSRQIYNQYGGKLFAVGMVCSDVITDTENDSYLRHYSTRTYTEIGEIYILENPIDTMEFKDFWNIMQHFASTPLSNYVFDKMKEIIIKQNDVPQYFLNAKVEP